MNDMEEKQILLDESYHIIFEIDQCLRTALHEPREDVFKNIDEHYDFVMQKKIKISF